MIKAEKLSYSFPNKDLYTNIDFELNQGDCCGFIGSSGSGKSTLIQIIQDPEKYLYDGKLSFGENFSLGFVSQFYDMDHSVSISVFDYIAEIFLNKQGEIDEICGQMCLDDVDMDKLLEQYQIALDEFEAIDGENYESNIMKKLNLANLGGHRDLDVGKLSGGEFKLVQVIKQMLTKPRLLIMDEPDAYLDFENLNALKQLISSYRGTMLVITHSRYLLNHCFNKIWHLENCQLQQFEGNYIQYNLELLAQKIDILELAAADTEEIARNEAMLERLEDLATEVDNPAYGRALNARRKVQERLIARRVDNPFVSVARPDLTLEGENILEDAVALTVENYHLAFDKPLLDDVNFEIKSTDKIAIIGANGTGKTSLIREIYQNQNPAIAWNSEIQLGYLSQNQQEIFGADGDDVTINDAFFDLGFASFDAISQYLEKFLFPLDKLNQKISSLSGGEKNILGLAKLACSGANFLLLDEPTSHLDSYSQLSLEEGLKNYNGGILMISHDFYAIVNCMDYVLILEDRGVRKMRMRTFRKMIYGHHFSHRYLELEQEKKQVEIQVETALFKGDFDGAKLHLAELEKLVDKIVAEM